MALLEIEGLTVEFGSVAAPLTAVDDVDLTIDAGEIVGCVGESGSGKSVTALALMGLVDFPGRVRARRMVFAGRELLSLSAAERRALTGKDIAMIFQDPLASLNPCFTVAFQLTETLRMHGTPEERGSAKLRRARALQLLQQVEIPDPAARLGAFPHQLSGGMAQRVMIAMAIACNPRLLIADEPTTALDVTVQAQVLDLLLRLQQERGMALLLITHDLAVVAETAQRVIVMYAGEQVETGPVPEIFDTPQHPYTKALLDALPEHNLDRTRLKAIPGVVPGQYDRPAGCLLSPRCDFALRALPGRPAAAGRPARTKGALPFRARCRRTADAWLGRRGGGNARRGRHSNERRRAAARGRSADSPLRGIARPVSRQGDRARARWRFVHRARRGNACRRRGIGLRQIDAGAPGHDDRAPDIRGIEARRRRRRRCRQGDVEALAPDGADGFPEPVRLAQSAQESRNPARGAVLRSTPASTRLRVARRHGR